MANVQQQRSASPTPHADAARAAVAAMLRAKAEGNEAAALREQRRAKRALDRHLAEYRRRLP
jgi:hypothetical protein